MKSHADLQEKLKYYQDVDRHAENHGQRSFQQTLPLIILPPKITLKLIDRHPLA